MAAGLIALTQLTGRAGDTEVKLVVPDDAATKLIDDDKGIVNAALNPMKKDDKVLPKDIKRAKVASLSRSARPTSAGDNPAISRSVNATWCSTRIAPLSITVNSS